MPITITYDIVEKSFKDPNDRPRINNCFTRLGWEHLGGSAWRYPKITTEFGLEDWFNHVVPALMYFRSIVVHAKLEVTKFTIDAHSETGFNGSYGTNILPALKIPMVASKMANPNSLSEKRLREFITDAAESLD